MMGFVVVIHIIVCLILITIVLVQRGRGGGLVESFSGLESMFGVKTNLFLTRTTTVCSIIFFSTCLLLTFFSLKQSRSLLRNRAPAHVSLPAPQKFPNASEQAELPVAAPKMPPIKLEEGFKKGTPAAPLKEVEPVAGLKPIQEAVPQNFPGQASEEKAAPAQGESKPK